MDAAEAADQIRIYAQSSPLSTLAGRTVSVRADWAGSDNLLWRLGAAPNGESAAQPDVVIKMYMDAGWVRGRREYEAQQLFAPLGLAPQPLWFDRDTELLPRQVVAYTWVEGDPPQPDDAGVRHALAAAMARVHSTDPAAMTRISPHPYSFDTYWPTLQASIAAAREEMAGEAELVGALDALARAATALADEAAPLWQNAPRTIIHGDFCLDNALLRPQGVLLLDWELAGQGDPALEAARFAQGHLLSDEARSTWLTDYLARVEQPGLAQRIAVYRQLLPLEWLCELVNGLPAAFAIYGSEINSDMVALLDVVFSASTASLHVARTLNTATIRRLVQGMSTRGTS